MTNAKAKEVLDRLGSIQISREHRMCCPRCGRDGMYVKIHTNALSRHANCYICPECGTDEAMRDYAGKPLPTSEWDIIKSVLDVLNGEDGSNE